MIFEAKFMRLFTFDSCINFEVNPPYEINFTWLCNKPIMITHTKIVP